MSPRSFDHLDSLSADAAAFEIETFAIETRETLSRLREYTHGSLAWRVLNDLDARAEELRAYAKRRSEQNEANLRAVMRADRARNFGIGES